MKQSEFKNFIKEAVREVIREELKDILLEAVRQPKTIVKETISHAEPIKEMHMTSNNVSPMRPNRQVIQSLLGDTIKEMNPYGQNGHVENFYNPPAVDTVSEGSRLPEGEVPLSQIMGLIK